MSPGSAHRRVDILRRASRVINVAVDVATPAVGPKLDDYRHLMPVVHFALEVDSVLVLVLVGAGHLLGPAAALLGNASVLAVQVREQFSRLADSLLDLFLLHLQFDCCSQVVVGQVVAVALAGAAFALSELAAIVEGELVAAVMALLVVAVVLPVVVGEGERLFDIAHLVVPFVAAVVAVVVAELVVLAFELVESFSSSYQYCAPTVVDAA